MVDDWFRVSMVSAQVYNFLITYVKMICSLVVVFGIVIGIARLDTIGASNFSVTIIFLMRSFSSINLVMDNFTKI